MNVNRTRGLWLKKKINYMYAVTLAIEFLVTHNAHIFKISNSVRVNVRTGFPYPLKPTRVQGGDRARARVIVLLVVSPRASCDRGDARRNPLIACGCVFIFKLDCSLN